MDTREQAYAFFLKDIKDHVVTIKHDTNGYRHLRCQKPGTWCMGFDIVTYPGMLVYSGDMGCFVFSRLADMFEFFRDGQARGEPIKINPYYWSEKLQAHPTHCGHKEYSKDLFREAVTRWVDEADLEPDARAEIMERLKDEVFCSANDGEHEARRALHAFDDKRMSFADFFEVNLQEYTTQFFWCCYALVWAIREYDAMSTGKLTGEAA